MEEIVPLISSSVMGPLGVVNLPRVWLKILLHARGRLADGYRHGNGGMDESLCVNLGIDNEAFVHYIETELPDYLQVEEWVKTHATKLDAASVAAHNMQTLTRNIRDELAVERRQRFGIADNTFANAVRLNDLDDWACAHALLTRDAPE